MREIYNKRIRVPWKVHIYSLEVKVLHFLEIQII